MADRDPKASRSLEDEDFLERWSRRKHRRAAQDREPGQSPDDGGVPAEGNADAEEAPPDLPPVESLDADSDFSRFLEERVPESFKRAALKKLFGLPQFNVRDGLDDYDEDYTAFAQLGDTITADMKHHAERLRQRAAEREAAAAREAPAERSGDADAASAAAEDPNATMPPDTEAPDDNDDA